MMDGISRTQIEFAIDEYIIGKNAERNREILRRRLIDGVCYEPLAEEFGLSTQQIKNVVYKYEKIVFSAVEKISKR